MSIYVPALVLTAAVLHAFWNLLAKKAKGGTTFIWLMYILSAGSPKVRSPHRCSAGKGNKHFIRRVYGFKCINEEDGKRRLVASLSILGGIIALNLT